MSLNFKLVGSFDEDPKTDNGRFLKSKKQPLTICRVTWTWQYWFESRRNYVETYQKLINTTSEKK